MEQLVKKITLLFKYTWTTITMRYEDSQVHEKR